jgi:serine/threonine-protein kinase RsbT
MPSNLPNEIRVAIGSDPDIVTARQKGRELAVQLGFTSSDSALIATAISELARNILLYARRGEVLLRVLEHGERRGLRVIAHDQGPGIANIELAMRDGYSTSGGLGLGLPGARRLMDEFELVSNGLGTTVTVTKWVR